MVRMMRDVSAALSMRMLPVRNNKSSFLLSSDSAISLQLQLSSTQAQVFNSFSVIYVYPNTKIII
ncbi:Uncharacterised protein [Segatella copri]|nr:Uncharacterised protein [Segatella copri]